MFRAPPPSGASPVVRREALSKHILSIYRENAAGNEEHKSQIKALFDRMGSVDDYFLTKEDQKLTQRLADYAQRSWVATHRWTCYIAVVYDPTAPINVDVSENNLEKIENFTRTALRRHYFAVLETRRVEGRRDLPREYGGPPLRLFSTIERLHHDEVYGQFQDSDPLGPERTIVSNTRYAEEFDKVSDEFDSAKTRLDEMTSSLDDLNERMGEDDYVFTLVDQKKMYDSVESAEEVVRLARIRCTLIIGLRDGPGPLRVLNAKLGESVRRAKALTMAYYAALLCLNKVEGFEGVRPFLFGDTRGRLEAEIAKLQAQEEQRLGSSS